MSVWPLMAGVVLLSMKTAEAAVNGVVPCAPDDPYRPLANEISAQTGYDLVDTPKTALAVDATYVVWVAAPTHFSDRDLVAYATQVRDRSSSVSLGFITGRTLEQARAFWHRGSGVRGTRFAIANGADPHTGRFSNRLVRIAGNERTLEPLTLVGLQEVLATSDYVTFTGHGTPTRLQVADIAGDKYLLVLQPGGEMTIQLSVVPPRWWFATSCLAALDSTLIFAMRHSFDFFQSAIGGVTCLAIAWSMRQRRSLGAVWPPFLLAAVVLGVMMGALGWLIAQGLGARTLNYHLLWPQIITLVMVLPGWAALVQLARPPLPRGRSNDRA